MQTPLSSDLTIVPVLTLGAYLKEQEAAQQRRPPDQRRHVPTYRELGNLTQVDPMTIYRQTTSNYLLQLPLDLAYRIIKVVRGLGFEMGVGDLVSWTLPEGLQCPLLGWQSELHLQVPGRLRVILGPCLDQCRALGIPSIPHVALLAEAAEVSRRQLERILADGGQRLDLSKLGKLVSALAQAGWGLTPEDVLLYSDLEPRPITDSGM